MATLYVRDIPDRLYRQIQSIASAQGRSLNAYIQQLLQQAVQEEQQRRARAEALASIRRRRRPLPANAPDSVTMLRQMRGDDE